MSDTPPTSKPSLNPWTIWVPIILIALGSVVFYNWILYTKGQAQGEKKDRPPYLDKAEDDLVLMERSGREVRMSELRGKILLIAWIDPDSPEVLPKLTELMKVYGATGRVQVVLFAVNLNATPLQLRELASSRGIGDDSPWWLVSGDAGRVGDFMSRELGLTPMRETDGGVVHDTRICLLDDQGNVRRLADLLNQDPEYADHWEKQLRRDLAYLLSETSTEPN